MLKAANLTRLIGGFIFLLLQIAPLSESQDTTTTPAPTTVPTTVEPTTVPENTDLGLCTCDLTGNGCDVNCCCDEECSTNDRLAFSSCDDESTTSDNQACVRSSVVFRENTPYTINETSDGLFCIVTDNYEERNYYEVPDIVISDIVFDEFVSKYGGTSYKRESTSTSLPRTYYQSGDALLTVYETNVVGRLGLPRAVTSQECVDTNPAAFLYDQTYSCIRAITDLSAECSNPVLDANTYFAFFRIIPTPEIFSENTTGDSNATESSTVSPTTEATTTSVLSTLFDIAVSITPLAPLICTDIDGFNSTCDFSTIDIKSPEYIGDTCTNAVVRVEYVITHNSTAGVTDAGIRLVFANISQNSLPLNQVFVSNFQKEGEDNTTERSGNPGYVVGEPILAGNITTVSDETGVDRQVIVVDSNRNNMLTMVTSSASGECVNDTASRIPVTFGLNMRSGCRIKVTFDDLQDNCQLISDAAVVALTGSQPPTNVATFGDVTVDEVEDWLPILSNDISGTGSTETGFCSNVVLGMHLEILYANVGNLGNAQPKIIGVKRIYQQSDLSFQCIGPYCQPTTQDLAQTFEVTSSVGFVDASSPSVDVDAEYPQFSARLPEDFFYPFT